MKATRAVAMILLILGFFVNLAIAQDNPASYELARRILGNDFITPDEVAKVRHLAYTEANLKHFADTMPSEETFRWCAANGYAVVAGPPAAMSIVGIRSLKQELFWSPDRSWYTKAAFANNDKVKTDWLVIRRWPVPNSLNKTWDEQYHLLSQNERVPNAAEVSWLIITLYEVRGIRIFQQIHVRTSSVTPIGTPVVVGYHEGKLAIFRWGSFYREKNIGIASCLR